MNDKLFFVTRTDLPPGDRAAQSVHGAIVFTLTYPELVRSWHDSSNNVVLLEAKDEAALAQLAARAAAAGVPLCMFSEPDLDNALTAVALGPTGYRLVSSLPLTLREKRAA
jgi:peptidyl-tRNA hydrolase